MKILNVVGARSDIMKFVPLMREYQNHPDKITAKLLYTGRKDDFDRSRVYFDKMDLIEPDLYLGVDDGTPARRMSRVMKMFEDVIVEEDPGWVLTTGDVDDTLACSLVASRRGIKVAHLDAGLRSFNNTETDEMNRIVIDTISNMLLTPSVDANWQLIREGFREDKIEFVGNIKIDAFRALRESDRGRGVFDRLNIIPHDYGYMALHRFPLDNKPEVNEAIIDALKKVQKSIPMVWPLLPHVSEKLEESGLLPRLEAMDQLFLVQPVDFTDHLVLMEAARFAFTDSRGMQADTISVGTPCVVLDKKDEPPVTLYKETNPLKGVKKEDIADALYGAMEKSLKKQKPLYWDGNTAMRIVKALLDRCTVDCDKVVN